MRTLLGVGVAALALFTASAATAACPDDINKFRTDLQNNPSFQQRYTAGKVDRSAYTRLFDAAQTFASAGLDRRCQEVLAGIKELSEKVEADAPRQAPGRADTGTDRRTDRTERLRAAQPLNAVSMSWDHLVGADVRNVSDNDLGEVEDVVMDKGQITGIVVERGGFLGMGQSHYMISADKVKIATFGESGRADSRIVVLDMTPDQVKAMPKVRKDRGAWLADDRTSPPSTAPAAPPTRGTTPTDRPPATAPRQ